MLSAIKKTFRILNKQDSDLLALTSTLFCFMELCEGH